MEILHPSITKSFLGKGDPIRPLELYLDETCTAIGHEGRHRAELALDLGVTKIPVHIFHDTSVYDAKGMDLWNTFVHGDTMTWDTWMAFQRTNIDPDKVCPLNRIRTGRDKTTKQLIQQRNKAREAVGLQTYKRLQ